MTEPIEILDPADPRLDDFRDLARADRRPDVPDGHRADRRKVAGSMAGVGQRVARRQPAGSMAGVGQRVARRQPAGSMAGAGPLVIAEGIPVVQRLLASSYPLRAVLGVRRRIDALTADMAEVDRPVYLVSAEVMARVVGFHLNRGVLASADRLPPWPVEELIGSATRIAVLEGVNDHENLGSIFRNAAAFGVDAVLLGPYCADPLYRRSVRVSMGHVLAVPFTELASAPKFAAWPEALDRLRDAGFAVLAMTPRASSLALRDIEPARYPRTAVLVGAEGPGLSDSALGAADVHVRIPMRAGVDSINVATAAAIAFAHLAWPR